MPIKNARWSETRTIDDGNGNPLELEVKFQYVDNGIGAFECHGHKGYDSRWTSEFISAQFRDGSYYDPSDKEIEKWEEDATPPEDDEDDYPPEDPEFEEDRDATGDDIKH